MTSVGPVHITGHDLSPDDLFPPDDPPPRCARCGKEPVDDEDDWCEACDDARYSWERA